MANGFDPDPIPEDGWTNENWLDDFFSDVQENLDDATAESTNVDTTGNVVSVDDLFENLDAEEKYDRAKEWFSETFNFDLGLTDKIFIIGLLLVGVKVIEALDTKSTKRYSYKPRGVSFGWGKGKSFSFR